MILCLSNWQILKSIGKNVVENGTVPHILLIEFKSVLSKVKMSTYFDSAIPVLNLYLRKIIIHLKRTVY